MNLPESYRRKIVEEARIKRLKERGITLPWEREVETTPDTKSRRSLNIGTSESVRETEDSEKTTR